MNNKRKMKKKKKNLWSEKGKETEVNQVVDSFGLVITQFHRQLGSTCCEPHTVQVMRVQSSIRIVWWGRRHQCRSDSPALLTNLSRTD
jgi:hypothetical protein